MSPPSADADFVALYGRMMNPDPTNEFMFQLGPAQAHTLPDEHTENNNDSTAGARNDRHMGGGGQPDRARQALE